MAIKRRFATEIILKDVATELRIRQDFGIALDVDQCDGMEWSSQS
jgi:hypothetical protein